MNKKAEKGLLKSLPKHRVQLLDLIFTLKSEPIPYRKYDVSKLLGREDSYRVRIGDIRLVYHVDWVYNMVDIEYIGSRGKAYKGL